MRSAPLVLLAGCAATLATISRVDSEGMLARCEVRRGWFLQQLLDECGAPLAIVRDRGEPGLACAVYETMSAEEISAVRAVFVCMKIDLYAVLAPPPLKNPETAAWVKPVPTGFKREPLRGREWLRVESARGLTKDSLDALKKAVEQ